MPRILAVLAVFLFVAVAPALSATSIVFPDKVDTLVMPATSTLTFGAFDSGGNDAASFKGAVVLSGTYYYGDVWQDGSTDQPVLALVPDRATRARLPHFKLGHAPQSITLGNESAFAQAVLSKDAIASLRKGSTVFVTGKVSVRADTFVAGVSCHDPYFNARFVAVESAAQKFAAPALPGPDC